MFFNNENDSNSNSDNDDYETIPDEEFIKSQKPRGKLISWPNTKGQPGPNINLKYFKKRYSTEEEKHFLFEKIKQKKKTELCKNYELYHDCYYKNECSFAHGIEELRQNCGLPKYKTRICKTFTDKSFCNFGTRCNYRHIIK